MGNVFERGSEWRKWDLHLHTPSSYDYKDGSITAQDIITTLYNNQIAAAAITDHHVMNVDFIKELQVLGKYKNITIFPGIELRADSRGSDPIHYIGIFPETADIDYLWGQIKPIIDKMIVQKKYEDDEIYYALDEGTKLIHDNGGLVSIHAGRKSNSIEEITNSLPYKMAEKKDIIVDYIDIFEMGQEKDLEEYRSKVFPHLGRPYPMIICSDNHNIHKYCVKQNMWIKADPTFEGLRQVIYEPEERIKIQQNSPDNKPHYLVIDKLVISSEHIYNSEIKFNSYLNTIIGGKSTGKSMLLKTIAAKFNKLTEKDNTDIVCELAKNSEIYWRDGETNTDALTVEFFPQGHMSYYAKSGDINKLLLEICLKRNNIKFQYEQYESKCANISTEIATKLIDFEQRVLTLDKLKEERKKYPKIERIKEQLEQLATQMAEFSEVITKEEYKKYDEFTIQIKTKSDEIVSLDVDKILLEIYFNSLEQTIVTPKGIEKFEDLSGKFEELKHSFHKEWKLILTKKLEQVEQNKEKLGVDRKKLEENREYTVLTKKIALSKEYSELEKQKNVQNEQLNQCEALTADIMKVEEEIKVIIENIQEKIKNYQDISTEISKTLSLEQDGIKIFSKSNFDKEQLKQQIEHFIYSDKQSQYMVETPEKYQALILKCLNDIADGSFDNGVLKRNVDRKSFLRELLQNRFNLALDLIYDNDSYDHMSEGKKAFVYLKLILEFSDNRHPLLIDQPEDDLDNRSIYNDLVSYIKSKKHTRQIILVTHNPNLVVAADAEEVIVANQHGSTTHNKDEKKFQYISGSLENTFRESNNTTILEAQGIREHVCDILEGGKEAFTKRENKYGFSKN